MFTSRGLKGKKRGVELDKEEEGKGSFAVDQLNPGHVMKLVLDMAQRTLTGIRLP